ncbi:MAG: ATP-binding protein [Eisenbergiella sp.]
MPWILRNAPQRADRAVYTFTFADTGIGINPRFSIKYFDAFSREYDSRMERAEGTGLGMAITKKVMDMLGGTVSCGKSGGQRNDIYRSTSCPDRPNNTGHTAPHARVLIADADREVCESSSGF